MNLLWGILGDSPLDAVHDALLRRNAPTMFLNQHQLEDVTLELDIGEDVSGVLCVGDRCVELKAISGIYLRPHDSATLRSSARGPTPEWRANRDAALEDALQVFAELAPALVLNRPCAMAGNASKPYQAGQILQAGPPRLVQLALKLVF